MWEITPTIFYLIIVTLVTIEVVLMDLGRSTFLTLFGQRLKEIRDARELSLRQLAIRCDIDYSDIGKIEKGKRNIQMSTVLELSKGLEIHPKELFDFKLDDKSSE